MTGGRTVGLGDLKRWGEEDSGKELGDEKDGKKKIEERDNWGKEFSGKEGWAEQGKAKDIIRGN